MEQKAILHSATVRYNISNNLEPSVMMNNDGFDIGDLEPPAQPTDGFDISNNLIPSVQLSNDGFDIEEIDPCATLSRDGFNIDLGVGPSANISNDGFDISDGLPNVNTPNDSIDGFDIGVGEITKPAALAKDGFDVDIDMGGKYTVSITV